VLGGGYGRVAGLALRAASGRSWYPCTWHGPHPAGSVQTGPHSAGRRGDERAAQVAQVASHGSRRADTTGMVRLPHACLATNRANGGTSHLRQR